MSLDLLRHRLAGQGSAATLALAREFREVEHRLAQLDDPLAGDLAAWREVYAGCAHLLQRDDPHLGRERRLVQHALSAPSQSPVARQARAWLERSRPTSALLVRRRDKTRDLLLRAIDTGGAVTALAVHPDGRRVLSAGTNGKIAVWDGETGARLDVLAGHEAAVRALCPCPPFFASCAADGSLTVWSLDGFAKLVSIAAHDGAANAITVIDKGRRIATAGEDGAVRVWALPSLEPGGSLCPGKACLRAVIACRNHSLVAAGGVGDRPVWWWGREGREPIVDLPGPRAAVTGLAHLRQDRIVASCEDGALYVWTWGDRDTQRSVVRREQHLLAVATFPDLPDAFASCRKGVVYAISPPGLSTIRETGRHSGPVDAIALWRRKRAVVTGGQDGLISWWRACPAQGKRGHAGPVTALVNHESLLCSGGADGVVMGWDGDKGRPVKETPAGTSPVTALASGPGAVFVGHEAGNLRAFGFQGRGGPKVVELGGHEAALGALCYVREAKTLVSGGWDGSVQTWTCRRDDGVEHAQAGQLRGHRGCVLAVAADGRRDLVWSGGWDREILVHRLSSRKLLGRLRGHGSPIVALAACRTALASASDDGKVGFCNLDELEEVEVKPGHEGPVTSFATTAEHAVSGGADGRVGVWSARERKCLHMVQASGEASRRAIRALAPSPSGRWCAAAGDDGSLRVLSLRTGAVVAGWLLDASATACCWVDGAIACGTRSGEVLLFDFLPPRSIAAVTWHRERPLIASLDSEGVLALGEWHGGAAFLEPLARRALVPGAWLGAAGNAPEVAWSGCGRALRILCGERAVVVDAATLETTSDPGGVWLPPLRTSPDGAWRIEPGIAEVRPLPRTS